MKKNIQLILVNRIKMLKIVGFFSWSLLMVIAGTVGQNYLGITKSYADGHAITSPAIVRLDRARLQGNNLGDFEPYEPDSGNLIARGHDISTVPMKILGSESGRVNPGKCPTMNLNMTN